LVSQRLQLFLAAGEVFVLGREIAGVGLRRNRPDLLLLVLFFSPLRFFEFAPFLVISQRTIDDTYHDGRAKNEAAQLLPESPVHFLTREASQGMAITVA
jgi:hypothetical protein